MTASEADVYINGLNKKVQPIARAVHDTLINLGCTSYVKTIYVGYDLNGVMVAASYGHADHVEVALAVDENHPDSRLVDASHLTWRTLPLALNLSTIRDTKDAKGLFVEACERIASDAHTVNRGNDYFIGRKRGRHSQNQRG